MDGFAIVMQWHDLWWFWALEHRLARYGFSHTLAYIVLSATVHKPSDKCHLHHLQTFTSIPLSKATSFWQIYPTLIWHASSIWPYMPNNSVRRKRYRIANCDANWPPCDSKCHMHCTHVQYKKKHGLFDKNTQCHSGWQWIKNTVVHSSILVASIWIRLPAWGYRIYTVSYTHLTLPTNREV